MQWTALAQAGVGIASYNVTRNGTALSTVTALSATDLTVAPSTSYTYGIAAMSYHMVAATTTVSGATPATVTSARRVGIRGTGAYWGGLGESVDMLSGNLSFTLPVLKAQARTGWKVGLNLSYNSQNWRQDTATWNLGKDVGYGYGWKLQAGSLAGQKVGGTIALFTRPADARRWGRRSRCRCHTLWA